MCMRWEYTPAHPGYGIFFFFSLVYKHLANLHEEIKIMVFVGPIWQLCLSLVFSFYFSLYLNHSCFWRYESCLILFFGNIHRFTWHDSLMEKLRHSCTTSPPYELRAYVNQYICKFFLCFFLLTTAARRYGRQRLFFLIILYLMIIDYRTYTMSYCIFVALLFFFFELRKMYTFAGCTEYFFHYWVFFASRFSLT